MTAPIYMAPPITSQVDVPPDLALNLTPEDPNYLGPPVRAAFFGPPGPVILGLGGFGLAKALGKPKAAPYVWGGIAAGLAVKGVWHWARTRQIREAYASLGLPDTFAGGPPGPIRCALIGLSVAKARGIKAGPYVWAGVGVGVVSRGVWAWAQSARAAREGNPADTGEAMAKTAKGMLGAVVLVGVVYGLWKLSEPSAQLTTR